MEHAAGPILECLQIRATYVNWAYDSVGSGVSLACNVLCASRSVEPVRNVMAHAQKPDLVFQQNGRVHLNRPGGGGQFSRLLAVEQCGSAVRPWIDHVPTYSARLLATHSIRIFPLNFPSRASPCAITFRTAYTHGPAMWLPGSLPCCAIWNTQILPPASRR